MTNPYTGQTKLDSEAKKLDFNRIGALRLTVMNSRM